jgi:hypothetical protein
MGCHDVSELLQRLTRLGSPSAARYQRGAKAVLVQQRLDGTPMPARLPAMREALIDGEVGLDGLLAVALPLEAMADRVPADAVLTADAVLAAAARGEAPDAAPPACAELLRIQASVWAAMLDQDGAQPREDRAMLLRGIRLGRARDGVVPIHGALMPEVAAQFQRICDATQSPRVAFADTIDGEDPIPDERTWPQRHHDTLATALSVAASSELLPTIGGAAPTLVVNRHQRRAIALRDGNCIIPACAVPAAWCEIHHVTDHAKGGPTHTDNGVLLCWYHHRFIDRSEWKIRMHHGVPEVQAPPWYDPTGKWRPVTTSRTRMLDLVGRRT